jgi:single-strand DNA-binding protein
VNRVVLVGRLTRDPDLRYTPTGVAVANFTLAINRPFANQDGNREADFINCVVWRRPAENLANYMKKGNQVGVDGRLQSRSYEGQDGKTVYVTEVVADSVEFLESKGSSQGQDTSRFQQNQGYNQNQNQNQNQQQSHQPNQNQGNPFTNDGEPIDISDDDLPF